MKFVRYWFLYIILPLIDSAGLRILFLSKQFKGAVFLDEKTAWEAFCRTGSVGDYLAYVQYRAEKEDAQAPEEDRDEDGYAGPGGFGGARG